MTVPIGDSFWMSIVRAVMRTMIVLATQRNTQFVASTLAEGFHRVLENPGSRTPAQAELEEAVADVYSALSITDELPKTGT